MGRERKLGETNRREFLAGSVGAIAAAKLGSKFAAAGEGGGARSSLPYGAAGASLSEVAPTPAAPLRVIIDTDPGVDDALAILLALRSPELKVEAITPVAGNVPLEFTLPNALKLVEIAGRD